MSRALLAAGALIILLGAGTGCATTAGGGYQWGSYEQDLFDYYHKPGSSDAVLARETAWLARLEADGRTPPPGLYAEVGTFLLLSGKSREAIAYYRKERQTWPESQTLMDAVIANLQQHELQGHGVKGGTDGEP